MGLHLENDEDAGKLLERMMEQFEIDIDVDEENETFGDGEKKFQN